jgi:hypothetical protein
MVFGSEQENGGGRYRRGKGEGGRGKERVGPGLGAGNTSGQIEREEAFSDAGVADE